MDKELYRKNRESGERGQGVNPNAVIAIDTTPATSRRGLGLRKKKKNRIFTSPASGRLISILTGLHRNWVLRERRRKAAEL